MKFRNPEERVGFDLNQKVNRRSFLEAAALSAGAQLLPKKEKLLKVADILDPKDEAVEKSENSSIRNFENLKPDPKEVPEFLVNYTEGFSSWLEIVEDQRKLMLSFLDSRRYREILLDAHENYFPNKTKLEINELVDKLIKDRRYNVEVLEIDFEKLEKGTLGFHDKKSCKIFMDEVQHRPSTIQEEEGTYETKNMEMFTAVHEFLHGTQYPNLMFAGSLQAVVDISKKGFRESGNAYLSKQLDSETSSLQISDDGRTEFDWESSIMLHRYQPNELVSFLMEVRTAFHCVSKTSKNREVLSFDMNEDLFTLRHLHFLKNNSEKIFQTIYFTSTTEASLGSKKQEKTSKFLYLVEKLGEDNFVELMNQGI